MLQQNNSKYHFCDIIIFIYIFSFFKKEKFKITEEHKKRVSLLRQCMIAYGEKDIPDLKDEEFNSSQRNQ